MTANDEIKSNSIAINEAQLLLAEKRTSLALMRTGIAILALPLTITSFLIVTSKYYDAFQVLHFIVPLGVLSLSLVVLGTYLIIRSMVRMRHYDNLIHEIKRKHTIFGELLD